MYTTENQLWQKPTGNIELQIIPQAENGWDEGELEQKADMLIARCYQILSEMKDKRDRMRLTF